MAYKLFSCNFRKFHLDEFLKKTKIVDWRQNRNLQIGDYIFMYVSTPLSEIKYLFRVLQTDISFEDSIDDSSFWNQPEDYNSGINKKFIRLQLITEFDNPLLSLSNLLKHGLKAAPQGGMNLNGALLDYILSVTDISIQPMERIARICWNTNFWRFPSGPEGKSRLSGIYEYDYGFGHEEWLFDDSKIIDGYHYSFLQQLNRESAPFDGAIRLHLFTKKSGEGKLYLGYIDNFEFIPQKEGRLISKIYKERGWLEDMVDSVKHIGGDASVFKGAGLSLFNCRFKFSDVHVDLSNMKTLSKEDVNTKGERYGALLKKKAEFKFVDELDFMAFFSGLEGNRSEESIERKTDYSKSRYDPIHKKMQNRIRKLLLETGVYSQVKLEVNRVDIVGLTKSNKFHFFELKTYAAKQSIREALGQILEYNHYPEKDYAEKMVIICPFPLEQDDRLYLKHLREEYGLKLFFRYYSLEHNILGEEE